MSGLLCALLLLFIFHDAVSGTHGLSTTDMSISYESILLGEVYIAGASLAGLLAIAFDRVRG